MKGNRKFRLNVFKITNDESDLLKRVVKKEQNGPFTLPLFLRFFDDAEINLILTITPPVFYRMRYQVQEPTECT